MAKHSLKSVFKAVSFVRRTRRNIYPPDDEPKQEPVSIPKAEAYRREHCPHQRTKDGGLGKWSVWKFSLSDFAQFGAGVFLYFSLLVKLGILFGILSLLSLPGIVLNSFGERLKTSSSGLEQMSLGNLGAGEADVLQLGPLQIDSRLYSVYLMVMDLVVVAVFVAGVGVVRKQLLRKARELDAKSVTAADYSIRVTGLPRDTVKRRELKAFFELRWGPVVDVSVCYNDGAILELYQRRGIVSQKIEAAKVNDNTREMAALRNEKSEIDIEIYDLKHELNKYTVCAYVTFLREGDKIECVRDYKDNNFLFQLFMPSELRFREAYRLHVVSAPEPSNILFHNLKYSRWSKALRRLTTFCASSACMVISFVVIFFASSYRNQLSGDTESCDVFSDDDLSRDAVVRSPEDTARVSCYCWSLGESVINETDLCYEWLHEQVVSSSLFAVAALSIVFVNFVLKTIVQKLAAWEKHSSVTAEESSTCLKLFVALFVNTALIALLADGDFSSFGFTLGFTGLHADFTPDWFATTGVSITVTMMINILSPHILPVLQIPLSRRLREYRAKKCLTQRQLNAVYDGDTFSLAERYAALLNTIYVCLFYGGGIPWLYVTTAAILVCTYWCDKTSLLRQYRTPPKYDASLAIEALGLMKRAVVAHLALSIWMFGSPSLLRSYSINTEVASQFAAESIATNTFARRLLQWSSLPLFLVLLVLVASAVLSNFLWLFAPHMLCAKKSGKYETETTGIPDYIEAFDQGVRFESYLVSDQPMYRDAFAESDSLRNLAPLEPLWVRDRRKIEAEEAQVREAQGY